MRLYKFAALILLGTATLWAQTGTTTAPSADKKTPAADAKPAHSARPAAKAAHKGCACAHAKDAKTECHCKEMMADLDAKHGEMCNHGKAENMSMANKDSKGDKTTMAKADCCGCCGGKCDRMKHKMEHDKASAPKPGV